LKEQPSVGPIVFHPLEPISVLADIDALSYQQTLLKNLKNVLKPPPKKKNFLKRLVKMIRPVDLAKVLNISKRSDSYLFSK
jgi:hypothetical protein